jgi:protein-disulfide isomerase
MTPIKRIILTFGVLAFGLAWALPAPALAAAPAVPAGPAPALAVPPVMRDIPEGNPKAPVTVIEYASFTCPHCGHFMNDVFPSIEKNYIETGKVRWIYRDFPLDKLAVYASVLARCGGAAHYYGFVKVLFEQQTDWVLAAKPMNALKQIGRLGGVSDQAFTACMEDKTLMDAPLKSRLQGENKYKIDATPTFIINGVKHVGDMPYKDFAKLFDSLIKSAGKGAAPAKS